MNASGALQFARNIFSKARGAAEAAPDAEILLASAIQSRREEIMAHPERLISNADFKRYREFLRQRREGRPIAYITHRKEFYGFDFYVDERVIIPRPETELLVDEAIKLCAAEKNPVMCDIGTGSGCIAIAIAKHMPHARITAVDISEGALEVARKNAQMHGVLGRIQFVQSDLLSAVDDRQFHCLIANLPYIGTNELNLVDKEVHENEPHGALYAGETGLEAYERLFGQVSVFGADAPRRMVLEFGFSERGRMEILIKKYFPAARPRFMQDLAGLDRCVTINL